MRDAAPEETIMKESDARRPQRAVRVLSEACLSFVSTGVCGRGRGICVEENGPVSRSIEGWEEGFVVCIYTPVFTGS